VSGPALILFAWAVEAACGWPRWLHARIAHPVVWLGALIDALDRTLNRAAWPHALRYAAGAAATALTTAIAAGSALAIVRILPNTLWGHAGEVLAASSLIASRSLYDHAAAVAAPLMRGDLARARAAASMIVGRDTHALDEGGIARASLESLSENASDGVVAPVFWGALFGLPGVAAYKAVNTLDSMIGHRNDAYAAFGGVAARADDIANLIPARLTGVFIAAASGRADAFAVMLRDAGASRSPNAGWPEAAMAGALGVRLSGPRAYGATLSDEPWINAGARDPDADDVRRGLGLYLRALVLAFAALAGLVLMAETG